MRVFDEKVDEIMGVLDRAVSCEPIKEIKHIDSQRFSNYVSNPFDLLTTGFIKRVAGDDINSINLSQKKYLNRKTKNLKKIQKQIQIMNGRTKLIGRRKKFS